MWNSKKIPSSFRDPDGFVFQHQGKTYRQINHSYSNTYEMLMKSGLYDNLIKSNLLIQHYGAAVSPLHEEIAFKVILPEQIDFISYPYEWCFSQLKRAALTTLEIQKRTLDFNMSLKDSSAFNIQFHQGNALLIDTLSFESYQEGKPWIAYRQFCQHFLSPLVLMAYRDVRFGRLCQLFIDGIPLDLASKLLPARTYLKPAILINIHLHAGAQKRYASRSVDLTAETKQVSKQSILGLINNLEKIVSNLRLRSSQTEWEDYHETHAYTGESVEHKRNIVAGFLDRINPQVVWDLGANIGYFSRIASERGISTCAFDFDHGAVERNYTETVEQKETHLLPLVMDLTNPSPDIGWANHERLSLVNRGPVDAVMALALIHHLAISNNVPLEQIADFFSRLGKWLVVEFVPKQDDQVKRLLKSRVDIFPNYNREQFEYTFKNYFNIVDMVNIKNTERYLYLMEKKSI